MRDLTLGLRLLLRTMRAGELTLLALALGLAVASMATVALFADRTRLALEQEANRLLGADLVLTSSRPIDPTFRQAARARGLSVVGTTAFRSMVLQGESSQLSEVTAVEAGYPLRGSTRIGAARGAPDRPADGIPPSGTLWGDERLVGQLNVGTGDTLSLGNAQFKLGALLTQDPTLTLSVLGMGPRILISQEDLAATGLIVPGSRVTYRLLVAGERTAIESFRAWAVSNLGRDVRMEGVRDARPEVRSALERAERFMGLAALTAVALATVAVMLAGRRFHARQLDVCAMLRCLGCSQRRVFLLQFIQLLGVGIVASAAGTLVGYLGQALLGSWLSSAVGVELPQPGWGAGLRACGLGLALLLAFGIPPLLSLRSVPALRVLRRDAVPPSLSGVIAYGAGAAGVAALVLWHAGDVRLGLYVLAGCLATLVVASLATWGGLQFLRRTSSAGVSWRYGVANLHRRPFTTIWQVIALSLGLAAVLTLTLIRSDLLTEWQASLPAEAPNRFLVNIQPDQVDTVKHLLRDRVGAVPVFYPMIRGRLVEINDVAVDPGKYTEDRARRLVEREFNLSWATAMPGHNRLVAGRWHADGEALSVEEGIARTLGIRLGDRLTYDVAGERFTAPVTSLRKVEWDSFRVNFFVIGTSSLLEQRPATYVTSFHLPQNSTEVMNEIVRAVPTMVVVDVAALVSQVQAMIAQVSKAITFVFAFTLAAGILVLYAGIDATHDERVREVAVMRTLGASRGQILRAHAAEFCIVGGLAGILAAGAASGLGYAVATRLLGLDLQIDPWVWLLGVGAGSLGVGFAGLLFSRRVLGTPPLASLRQLA